MYLPSAHNVHGPPSGPDEPAPHFVLQSPRLMAPGLVVLPLGQDRQLALPAVCAYFPDGQMKHGALPLEPAYPAMQEQAVDAELPAGEEESVGHAKHVLADVAPVAAENFPAPQSLQASFPDTGLNLPGTQLVHVSPFGPEEPALQAH